MYPVKENLLKVKQTLHEGIELVAVSKFHPKEYIEEAYAAGQRIFGESREQELKQKHQELPQDIEWHFIGHLQTNKVKYIAPYIDMIDAVDSMKLLREIHKQAQKNNRIINVLLELHIAEEETKYGFSLDECRQMLAEGQWRELQNVRICGLMMMASYVDDPEVIRREMTLASDFFDEMKAAHFANDDNFCDRSWGMSHDYHIALECNTTMVRIGTSIFGPRVY